MKTKSTSRGFWRGGHAWVFLTSGATAISLILILAVFYLILRGGLGFFWPSPLTEYLLDDGQVLLGQEWNREMVPASDAAYPDEERILIRAGNRRLFRDREFSWVNESQIRSMKKPHDSIQIERLEYGQFFGYLRAYRIDDQIVARDQDAVEQLADRLGALHNLHDRVERLGQKDTGRINAALESARLAIRRIEIDRREDSPEGRREIDRQEQRIAELEEEYVTLEIEIAGLREQLESEVLELETADGTTTTLAVGRVVRAFQPNRLNVLGKAGIYTDRVVEFVTGNPREANTEGGVFPAIFGTVLLVFLMTFAVVPLGVIAALYLREYAKQGNLVHAVRIAVNNLAGIPSIVFGIFGLGFFIYTVGGAIDRTFFPEALPTPTFGTGGILWSALTLALLTMPVVIVATEEGLAAVPSAVREGSLALGATKWETIRKVVLPAASPGILTGVILAIARAAGEVAPLMLTGAVKTAMELPLDRAAPFLHLDRKFMHLGFHIYDVGFQSPNVEAAKPMVYMTTILLIVIVFLLNVVAMAVRNRLRAKYTSASF